MADTVACLHFAIATGSLFDPDPALRVSSARSAGRLATRSVMRRTAGWPLFSPGAANAWLLMVTAKPPTWRDPMMTWPDEGPALGRPHPGFFYPDPLGFWTEMRRWVAVLVRTAVPTLSTSDALSVAAVIHAGEDADRVRRAIECCAPQIVLFLDEASRELAGVAAGATISIPDPHREGTTYDGWWLRSPDGIIWGKAPQHPASHRFYRAEDMNSYLRAAPLRQVPSFGPN